jgi:hypothetical protein
VPPGGEVCGAGGGSAYDDHGLRRGHDDVSVSVSDHVGDHDHDHAGGGERERESVAVRDGDGDPEVLVSHRAAGGRVPVVPGGGGHAGVVRRRG